VNYHRYAAIAMLVVGLGAITNSQAQPTVIFIANHDVKLTVAGELGHITSQAKVRDGRSFPVNFETYRLDIGISNIGNGSYLASVNIYENTDDGWYKVNVDELSFEAAYAAPTQFKWSVGDISLDLGIAVSIFPQ